MTELIPATEAERLVGAWRHQTRHIARASVADQAVYVLHSRDCVAATPDLRDCWHSRALDNGVNVVRWSATNGEPTWAEVGDGELIPAGPVTTWHKHKMEEL